MQRYSFESCTLNMLGPVKVISAQRNPTGEWVRWEDVVAHTDRCGCKCGEPIRRMVDTDYGVWIADTYPGHGNIMSKIDELVDAVNVLRSK